MNIVLAAINGRYNHTALGIYSLRAAAEEKGFAVTIKEWTLKTDVEVMLKDILRLRPQVLGCSVYLWNFALFRELAARVKTLLPEVILLWGGPEVTGRGETLLKECGDIDYLMLGEGEAVFPQLLESLRTGGSCRIPGVAGRENGEVYAAVATEPLAMGTLPSPYRQMAGWADLAELDLSHRMIYYETSRGCPFHCSFCFSGGDRPRYRPMEQVEEDLLHLLSLGVKQVKFLDRTFNFPAERSRRLVQFLLEHYQPGINFHMEIAPQLLDEDFLVLLSKSPRGYLQMEAGIQTLYPPALKAINRTMHWETVQKCLRSIIEQDNCHVHVDLIAGLPTEGLAEFAKSFNGVYSLFAHQIQLGFLKVLPGSRLDRERETWGLVFAVEAPYEILSTPQMTEEEVQVLHRVDKVVDCFFNSNRFRETFRYLLQHIEGFDPFDFFLRFGKFLPAARQEWKQLPQRSLLLYEFLMVEYPGKNHLWRDLLAVDWVLSGSGERLPAHLADRKTVKTPAAKAYLADRVVLRLQHRILWNRQGIEGMLPGESYWAFSSQQTWGLFHRPVYDEVTAFFTEVGEELREKK